MVWIGIPVGLYLLLCLVMFLVQDALLFPGAGRSPDFIWSGHSSSSGGPTTMRTYS